MSSSKIAHGESEGTQEAVAFSETLFLGIASGASGTGPDRI
jgi:hypothetical protein